jgi:AraC-like DNA-binding protein
MPDKYCARWLFSGAFFFFILTTSLHGNYHILSPQPFTVIRTDWLKIQLGYDPSIKKPDSVHYQINTLGVGKDRLETIRVAFPFEYVNDLKKYHDANLYIKALVFNADSIETLGLDHEYRGVPVALDRETSFKKIACISPYSSKRLPAQERVSDSISGPNNTLYFYSFWDRESLYLEMDVRDQHLNQRAVHSKPLGTVQDYFKTLWNADGVEICLDTRHDRSEWKHLDDYELIISISEDWQGNTWDLRKKAYLHWGENVRIRLELSGTVNDNRDLDRGYTVSVAVPWKTLNIIPDPEDTLGFDLQMFDLDIKEGTIFRSVWSHCEFSNNDNPSEWGNLLLVKSSCCRIGLWLVLSAGLLCLTGGILLLLKRGSANRRNMPDLTKEQESSVIKAVKSYIRENYQDDGLNRKKVAQAVNYSEYYIGILFKKQTGTNLIDYIHQIRINNAVDLLKKGKFSVNEVAYSSGYRSIQHFNKIFKKLTGKIPSDFK